MENSNPDLIYTTFHACVHVNPQTYTFAPQVNSLKHPFNFQHFHLMKKYNRCTHSSSKMTKLNKMHPQTACLHPEREPKDVTAGCNLDQHPASKLRHGLWNYGSASASRFKICQNFEAGYVPLESTLNYTWTSSRISEFIFCLSFMKQIFSALKCKMIQYDAKKCRAYLQLSPHSQILRKQTLHKLRWPWRH